MTYFNHSLLRSVTEHIERSRNDGAHLEQINKEAAGLQQAIADGFIGIGEMMGSLAIFSSEPNQNITSEALTNEAIAQIGGLLQANGYLLNLLREASEDSCFHLDRLAKQAKQ